MRSIKTAFAALALGVATSAFAAAGPASHTVTLTNGMTDTLTVTGDLVFTFTNAIRGADVTNSDALLSYSTNSETNGLVASDYKRKVLVKSSAALPANVSGTVEFTTTFGTAVAADLGITTDADFITGIPRFITQDAAPLTYTLKATNGFVSTNITVTYTLADE